jgi:phosphoglycerate dehydrogenase-like enzyme
MPENKFIVTMTADFFDAAGCPKYRDLGLAVFDGQEHVERCVFSEHRAEIGPDQIGDAQGVIVLTPRVTAHSLSRPEEILAIGRFGVGYDSVDVAACTAADVLLFITAGAVDRPVAEAVVGWMIALAHNVRIKDALVRTGRWDDRSRHMGGELRERTLGTIGLGRIARATVGLLQGFGMNPPLAYDPLVEPSVAQRLGVRMAGLDELLREADFVSLHCPLNSSTRDMIGARELSLMKPGAYLINAARGGIVDEDALYEALKAGRIAGAAIDCFAQEPVTSPHRFGELDNVPPGAPQHRLDQRALPRHRPDGLPGHGGPFAGPAAQRCDQRRGL